MVFSHMWKIWHWAARATAVYATKIVDVAVDLVGLITTTSGAGVKSVYILGHQGEALSEVLLELDERLMGCIG
jgi:hypothetical protein